MVSLTRSAARYVSKLSNKVRHRLDALAARQEFSGSQGRTLHFLLAQTGDVFQKDLEAAFKIRKSTVSCMVELMEQKGMLTRESVNGDARLKRLVLTEKAEKLLTAVSNGVERMESEVRAEFTETEFGTLTELLGKLSDVLESRELTTNERNPDN